VEAFVSGRHMDLGGLIGSVAGARASVHIDLYNALSDRDVRVGVASRSVADR
jgi:hypothetical protein